MVGISGWLVVWYDCLVGIVGWYGWSVGRLNGWYIWMVDCFWVVDGDGWFDEHLVWLMCLVCLVRLGLVCL